MPGNDAGPISALTLRTKWSRGEVAFGAWAAIPSAFAAELMCVDGVDYVCIDQQHGLVDYPAALEMLRAIEGRRVVPLTRVPANEAWLIAKALDAGIQGVVVPMVNTRAEAERAVQSCRYAPRGIRSYGPVRSALTMNSRDVTVVGDGVLCFVIIETPQGVAAVDEIAGTPGLDGIYVGPADLALSMGFPPDLDKEEPEHVAAVQQILAACKRHGIVAGIQCGSGRSALHYAKLGFQFVTFAKDSSLLPAAIEKEIGVVLGRTAASPAGVGRGYT
jgi:4-hydroxy-2-oxoheptanedioate aldolase